MQPRGRPAGSPVSRAEVERRMLDPRYDATKPTFEKGFYDETNRLFEQTAG